MDTRYRATRRPEVSRRFGGVNFVPNEIHETPEKNAQYKDLKKLKNGPSFIPELSLLTAPTEPSDTVMKVVQPQSDDLEQDGAPLELSLSESYDGMLEKTELIPEIVQETGQNDWNQKLFDNNFLFLETNIGSDKTSLVPDLPRLEDERDLLETMKKTELKTPDLPEYSRCDPHVDSSNSIQTDLEDSFVSVQTKKGFSKKLRSSTVSAVPKEDLVYNFVQQELRQSQQLDHFVPNTVQYTTKKALDQFIHSLPQLTSGTHGCIVEEGFSPDGQQYIENAHFVTDRQLGRGSFGTVDLVIDSTSNKHLVRKQLEKSQMQVAEVIIPLNLNNVHVTKVFGLIQREDQGMLKMELLLEYAGTSLNNYLIREGNILTPDQIWQLTKQALEGLAHIHKYGMIHLDIKPENLCIQGANDGLQLKITDFGSAKLPYEDISFNGWTPEYMAPECCQYFLQTTQNVKFDLVQEDITGKVDVFALFLVIGYMYEKKHVLLSLITQGKGNYHGLAVEQKKELQIQLIVMLASDGADVDALINDSCDLDMRDLLKRMSYPKESRLTAREALDIVERREQIQQQIQRDKELKLQLLQQQLLRRVKQPEFQYPVPDLDKIGLPATVMPEMNCERSIIKDKLREKLMPYKKMPRPEVPKTPLTPVEEMQRLQIRMGSSRGKSMEEQGHYKAPLKMIREERIPPMMVDTGGRTAYTTPRQSTEHTRPFPAVKTPVDTSRMPTPAVLMAQSFSPAAKMDYDGFIDLKTKKPDSGDMQGNIPKIVFDM